jgi:hypothetical protein
MPTMHNGFSETAAQADIDLPCDAIGFERNLAIRTALFV